ncbi:adenylate/guanylate cyclase domain-containing protein [Bradyrhizobium sp. CB82]|uniref:AAA family ATPase n=1 Tax=Bradyrhizobium sp. CB82 TaxID=3039159 RepID=UPI0024B2475D|nr:adenylate/guanylate cyclase domain-containing protein [Bradyrhizobium sp. CB82]WFU43267.1 adenylate/guanylate cyclase domain-containing protein [Bradyrhizobium sp. CB82]
MTDLQHWLEEIGLAQYAELFVSNDIDWEILPDLTERDLEKLGVSLGHRKKLVKAIQARCGSSHAASRSVDPRSPHTTTQSAERRHLTVLFCDLVGSTSLSAQLDPEELRKILFDFQRCCGDAIRRYDGHIARLMGDGVLAYFGFPSAHEDDAERAVKAALEMVESVPAVAVPVAGKLEVRIGIASGLVVVGDLIGEGPSREFALVGDAPNLASRLQALAEPSQILVAPRTRLLLGGLFEFADLGDHNLKGFERPIRVWRVVAPGSLSSRFEARTSLHLTPLIGRQAEVRLLHKQYSKAKHGKGQIVLISGEPGIGKSRLILALRHRLAGDRYGFLQFQCSSYHTSSALHPVIHYLEHAADIARDTSAAARLNKLEDLVRRTTDQAKSIVPPLAALLSIPPDDRYPQRELTPEQLKGQTFSALLTLLQASAERQPMILVFEDVHWADPTSLELLERIRDSVRNWRVLVILLHRPNLTLPWAEQPHVTSLAVNRLDRVQVSSMVQSLTRGKDLPRTAIDQILAKTDGVPLFVEEITKAVLESGGGGSREERSGAHSTLLVPDTLHDSLMARLDLLAPAKTVAQIASVIGRDFSLELLKATAPFSESDVQAAIDRLLASGLVFRSGHLSDQSFSFKHALLRDEAYASILNDQRRKLHGRIADILCRDVPEIAHTAPEIVAQHYAEAGRPEFAIDYWMRAARQASARSAFVEASTHLQMALKRLLDLPSGLERDNRELQLQQSLGNAFAASKGFAAAETVEAYKRALELCNTAKSPDQRFAVLNGIIAFHVTRGDFEQSRTLAEELLMRAQQQDNAMPKLIGHRALGQALFLIGELASARDHLSNSLGLYDATHHAPLTPIVSQTYLTLASTLLGDVDRGLASGQDAVRLAEQHQHPHSLCNALAFLAGAHVLCGASDAAFPVAERTVRLATEYAFPLWLAGGRMLRGWASCDRGNVEEGLPELRKSVKALEATGALIWVQFARYLLAQAFAKAEQLVDAMKLVDQTLLTVAGTSGRWYEAELHRLKGDLLVRGNGSPAAAEICYERAIAVAARQGARLWQLRASNALAGLWCSQGKIPAARALLAPLSTSIDGKIIIPDLRCTKALLAENA